MATITTDTYLDGGTARTAGEAWNVSNLATLTVRTDTRWHANAPASMTGTLGSFTAAATGAGLFIDGTQVRWMAFDTGSGTVPAIGATITQGGVSGYLLGVWADYTSAPTAVGAAMPASGFLKFREVTGGQYSAGALTGISANATSPDVVGWMEVVFDTSANWVFTRPGLGFKIRGAWFELGTTNGSIGQTFQVPTNAGGANTSVSGVQIETAPGSGVYEWYPALAAAFGWATARLNTDVAAKFVQSVGGGLIRIGSDGTVNVGYVPAAGCKVRIPNVLGRQATTATRATNAVVTSKTGFGGGGAAGSTIDLEIAHLDWLISSSFAFSTRYKSVAVEGTIQAIGGWSPFEIDDCCIGALSNTTFGSMRLEQANGGTFTNSVIARWDGGSANSSCITTSSSTGISISNVRSVIFNRTNTTVWGLYFLNATNCTADNVQFTGCALSINGSKDITVTNYDFMDRANGDTTTSVVQDCVFVTTSQNVLVDGITFGLNGTLSNRNPAGQMVFTNTNIGNIRIRNAGTRSVPLQCNANAPSYMWRTINDRDTKIQRIYLERLRSGFILAQQTKVFDTIAENLFAGATSGFNISQTCSNLIARGLAFFGSTASVFSDPAGVYGHHVFDGFTSATNGIIRFQPNEPNDTSASFTDTNFTDARSGFTGAGTVNLYAVGEYFEIETPYFITGHTAFVSVTGSSGLGQYQIDTGAGWNGTWKNTTGVNLAAEVIPSTGFKLKLRLANTSGSLTTYGNVQITTASTLAAQVAALYTLDTSSLAFTGLIAGSEIRVYDGTDPATATEIGGTESSGTTFSFSHSSGGNDGVIVILAMGYQPIYLPYTFKSTDDSILIQPVVDRNYVNP